eukprot:4357852-Amphidinium_carterae.1
MPHSPDIILLKRSILAQQKGEQVMLSHRKVHHGLTSCCFRTGQKYYCWAFPDIGEWSLFLYASVLSRTHKRLQHVLKKTPSCKVVFSDDKDSIREQTHHVTHGFGFLWRTFRGSSSGFGFATTPYGLG